MCLLFCSCIITIFQRDSQFDKNQLVNDDVYYAFFVAVYDLDFTSFYILHSLKTVHFEVLDTVKDCLIFQKLLP